MRIGTAAAVLCGSLYLYVVCIVSEGGTLFLYVRVFRLYSNPSSIYVPTLTPPSGVLAKKKTFVGKQNWLASPMIDATEWCSYTNEMRHCSVLLIAYA